MTVAPEKTQLDVPEGRVLDFATDTADAIASGTHAAMLGLVERCVRLGQARLAATPVVLLAGGGAGLFAQLGSPVIVVPSLVLDGLARLVLAEATS